MVFPESKGACYMTIHNNCKVKYARTSVSARAHTHTSESARFELGFL